ncbi:hypothetical protein BLNAU_21731 [Blattamonas nauphoetae]|uniref:Uncharacterized protein n=1 Tax=Blattamonas nauphoetae TaxID=2049346 RepID=A0ABQ9WVM0_9EUKA|nr:hypothetical protein BLNAU_21731 [Blattamonas nauphoetae]
MLPGLRQLADMKVELVKLLTALRDNDEEQLLIYERMRVPGNTQRTIAPLFHIARLTSVATDQILGMDSSEWLGITPPEDQWTCNDLCLRPRMEEEDGHQLHFKIWTITTMYVSSNRWKNKVRQWLMKDLLLKGELCSTANLF